MVVVQNFSRAKKTSSLRQALIEIRSIVADTYYRYIQVGHKESDMIDHSYLSGGGGGAEIG